MAAERADKEKIYNDEPIQVHTEPSPEGFNEVDCEKHGANRESNPLPDLKRKLKSRHLQMIAIGMSTAPIIFKARYIDSSQVGPLALVFSSVAAVRLPMQAQSVL